MWLKNYNGFSLSGGIAINLSGHPCRDSPEFVHHRSGHPRSWCSAGKKSTGLFS
jgi:hypothetical protein